MKSEAVRFWWNLRHRPGDKCPLDLRGVRREPWVEAHTVEPPEILRPALGQRPHTDMERL